jgi:hypothetical protein
MARVARRSLTPLSSELGFDEVRPGKKSWRERLRRERRAPTTRGGAIARGLLRLAVWVAVGVGIALLVNALVHRATAFGFYVTGAGLLAIGFLTSTGSSRGAGYVSQYERAGRVSRSLVWILVGAIVLAIGVLVEAFG